jgi:cell wall-associated NlpC family hydrolase
MMGSAAWTAAVALIGTRFRLHGRDPSSGLDCVGLVAAAYGAAGWPVTGVPQRYRLSGPSRRVAEEWLSACGARAVTDRVRAGDILLANMLANMGADEQVQLHLFLLGPGGAVHAHAGIGQVVLSPLPLPGCALSRWRLIGQE